MVTRDYFVSLLRENEAVQSKKGILCFIPHEKRIRFLFAVVQHVTSEKSFYFLCVREFSAIELRKDLIPVVHSYSAGYVGNSGLRGPGPVEACFYAILRTCAHSPARPYHTYHASVACSASASIIHLLMMAIPSTQKRIILLFAGEDVTNLF